MVETEPITFVVHRWSVSGSEDDSHIERLGPFNNFETAASKISEFEGDIDPDAIAERLLDVGSFHGRYHSYYTETT